MRKPWLSWWLGLAVMWVGAQHAAPLHAQRVAPRIEVVPHEDLRRVDVLVDGKPFTSYSWPTTLKTPTLYPLRAASGVVVTRGWPLDPRPGERVDHPHQVGLWFDHGDVNGLDFWNNSDAIPAARADKMGTILHRAVRRAQSGSGEGTLEVTADWVDSHGTPLLREDTRFVFRAGPGLRAVDRITTLTAAEGEPVTLAILDHPGNVGFPTYWHARGYGLFAANPLGEKVFTNGKSERNFRLAPGQSTTFRHRILILSGTATPDQIETYYRDFTR